MARRSKKSREGGNLPSIADPVIYRDEKGRFRIALVTQLRPRDNSLDLMYVVPITDGRGPGMSWTRSVWAIRRGTGKKGETNVWYEGGMSLNSGTGDGKA